MDLVAFITQTRALLDDVVYPQEWSDGEITDYINRAIREFCHKTKILKDSVTPEVCEVPVSAGVGVYTLNALITKVDRVKLDGSTRPLTKTDAEEMDSKWPDWEAAVGPPVGYLIDEAVTMLRLVPAPEADGLVRLWVRRLPLLPLVNPADSPEIPQVYHDYLFDGILALAYSKQDAETYDPTRAERYRSTFLRHCEETARAVINTETGDLTIRLHQGFM